GNWKLFLDHHFAVSQEINPQELYELNHDQQEVKNLLNDQHQNVTKYLIEQAKRSAGDNGSTRQLEQ
ncbi:MAG: hypothetical protein ABGW78_13725, partial [Pirellulales bacterium]